MAVMPGCLECGRQWPEGYLRCPEDGAALSDVAVGVTATAAAPALAYPAESDDELPVGSVAGEYRIEKKIGEGGMGSVYGARHPLIGKRAAIKVIRRELSRSREAVDRFVLEAQSVNQIGHPNIVDVFGFGQLPDGRSFFVMEWLQGESLRDRLQRPLPLPEGLDILEQIAKALQAAHEAGVVHRDLKPDNVFLASVRGEKAQVKLLDFGLAKLTGSDTQKIDRTRTGMVMGTPLYLSPEQAKGTKIDVATDVYSLGAMAYEMFSGVVPFKADSAVEIMAMHISQQAPPLAEIASWLPAGLTELVHAMLEKDPRARPLAAHVREKLAMLRASTSGVAVMQMGGSSQAHWTPHGYMTPHGQMAPSGHVPPQATPLSGAVSAQPVRSKRSIAIIGGLALVGVGAAVVMFVMLGGNTSKPQASEQPSQVEVAGAEPKTEPVKMDSVPADPVGTTPSGAPSETGNTTTPTPDPAAVPRADTDPPNKSDTDPTPAPKATPKADPIKKSDPVKKLGRLAIVFEGPRRAMIVIDGKPHGRELAGRTVIELPVGEHTVRVHARGYKPADAKVRVDGGGTREVKLTLEKRKNINAVHDPFAD